MNNSIITMEGVGACDALGGISFIWSPPSQLERTGMDEWVWDAKTAEAFSLKPKIWKMREVPLSRSKKYTFLVVEQD